MKKSKKPLPSRIKYRPYRFENDRHERERFYFITKTYGQQIPVPILQIMFGRGRKMVMDAVSVSASKLSRTEKLRMFQRWMTTNSISSLTQLDAAERIYLRELRLEIIRVQSPSRRTVESNLRRKAERIASRAAALLERNPEEPLAACSKAECSSSFPLRREFFPTWQGPGRSPGRCVLCVSKRQSNSDRKRRTFGLRADRAPGVELDGELMDLFQEMDRLEIPAAVIAEALNVSTSQLASKRKSKISRTDGLKRHYKWIRLPEAPRYSSLPETINRSIAKSWRRLRTHGRGCKDATSYSERRRELMTFTANLLAADPTTPTKRCPRCGNSYALDDLCFHTLRIKSRGTANYVRRCIPCVNEARQNG